MGRINRTRESGDHQELHTYAVATVSRRRWWQRKSGMHVKAALLANK
jgi:hypothetical protein